MMCPHPGCDVDHGAELPATQAEVLEAEVEIAEHHAAEAEVYAEGEAARQDAETERVEDANDTAEAIAQIDADARVEQVRLETEAQTEQTQIMADALVDTAVVEETAVETETDTSAETEAAAEEPAAEAEEVSVPPQVEEEAGGDGKDDKSERKAAPRRRNAFGARRGR